MSALLCTQDVYGETALFTAIAHNRIKVVESLLVGVGALIRCWGSFRLLPGASYCIFLLF